jgi:hypothetical protein
MKFTVFASLIILLGASSAFAADIAAGTAGRPNAVLSEANCVAVWHTAVGEELSRFHRDRDGLIPVNARGIVTNFQQADTDSDGTVSRAEFIQACKLGLVAGGEADRNIAAGSFY